MKTCGTCLYWAPNDGATGGCMELNNPHGAETAYLTVVQTEPSDAVTVLILTDHIHGSIVTRPEFGCVLHVIKGEG